MKKIVIMISLIAIALLCKAQDYLGPRLTAMGNNGAAVKDIWSIESNVANITSAITPTIALGYTKYLFDTELSKQSIIFVLPVNSNALGISLQRYGITAYNEIKAGLAFAKEFGTHLSIGVKANYHQIKISNYGVSNTFTVDVGLNYTLNKQLNTGLYFQNPSQQDYLEKLSNIPSIVGIGATYQPFDKILIASTISKNFYAGFNVGLGMDYILIDALSLRCGISTAPFKQYGGFGIHVKNLNIDAAVTNDINLGFTPQIAIAYAF